jgi:hypothetical protein
MQAGDPRADPAVVDLIELAGLWVAAGDWPALLRTLRRLDDVLQHRFPDHATFASRFQSLREIVEADGTSAEAIRRTYRQASFG